MENSTSIGSTSVPEAAHAGEDYGQAEAIDGGDDFFDGDLECE
ncbi:MAG: hypothetical protein ABR991_04560 [Terracidiphilus sp.]|jgi:hypothetical protein